MTSQEQKEMQDSDDGYTNAQQRDVAASKLFRNCDTPCGDWFLSPFDTWERCPCCPDDWTSEDWHSVAG